MRLKAIALYFPGVLRSFAAMRIISGFRFSFLLCLGILSCCFLVACGSSRERPSKDAQVDDGFVNDTGGDDQDGGERDGTLWDGFIPDAGEVPYLFIVFPEEGDEVLNPVTFEFYGGGGVETVEFECDGWPLQQEPIPISEQQNAWHTYSFSGVNFERTVVLKGFDEEGEWVVTDEVTFTPIQEGCSIPVQPGFNEYTVRAINDWSRFPKDGTYPYCWEYYGQSCGATWGHIHDGYYATESMFPGGGDCFCSGHTLEIFLWAYRLWLAENGLSEDVLFEYSGNVLSAGEVDVGHFYQRWQGFGVADYASSADAFEEAGIGANLYQGDWDDVLPGDYVNLSRNNGTGHAVIFVDWVWEGGQRAGLRYYGCNSSGDSCPDSGDPENTTGNSGPSFKTEYFSTHGGSVLTTYLFIGRVYLPN